MKTRFAAVVLLIVAVLATVALVLPLRAQVPTTRWEYCVINQTGGNYPTNVTYYTLVGVRRETVQGEDSYAKTLCKLGADGWELVSVAAPNNYFKRPVR